MRAACSFSSNLFLFSAYLARCLAELSAFSCAVRFRASAAAEAARECASGGGGGGGGGNGGGVGGGGGGGRGGV